MASSSGSDDNPERLITTVGFPEEQSLRHIIRTRFPHGMPEASIAIIMRQILRALYYLYVSVSSDHNVVNSSKICVDTEQGRTTIKLAVDPGMHLGEEGGAARDEVEAPTEGILGLGITALEMGYGSLPRPRDCDGLGDSLRLTYNVIRILKLKLAYPEKKGKDKAKNKGLTYNVIRILKLKLGHPDKRGKEKAKNKGKGKLESADNQKLKEKAIQEGEEELEIDDDQEMKEKAMQKRKGKLPIADDQELKEMAMQKGKEKLEHADDPKGKDMTKQKGKEKLEAFDDQELKEKAKQKGKEKLEIADEEPKESMIKLPSLEKLLNTRYIEHLEKKFKKKKAIVAVREKFKAMKIFAKNKNKNSDEREFSDDNADEKEFSRDFLKVVLMCLEDFDLTGVEQILDQHFFKQPIDVQEFECSMRSPFPSDDDN